jgi:ribosome-associated protein
MPRSRPPSFDDAPSPPADPDTAHGYDGPSKSELKRRMHDLQELGEAVAELPAGRLAALKIEDRLRDAIAELGRTRSHEGRRRQLQYIGKLMKFEDAEALREAVASYRLGSARDTLALHQAEAWRDLLIAEDDAFERWLAAHPDTDTQQMRSLVRSARKEGTDAGARHGRAYRDLFQMVKRHMAAAAPGSGEPSLEEDADDE